MNLSLLNLIIMVLALARLTRLITFDTLFRPLRHWVEDAERRQHRKKNALWQSSDVSFAYLVTCPWCMSIWLGAVVFGSTAAWGDGQWLWWIWGGFAASYVVGLLAEKVED